MEDLIKSLGYMALGTRLKRIAETLQTQTQVILDEHSPNAPPASHHAILMALDVHGALTIGALAQALRQSQPGVTRMVGKLTKMGLIEKREDPKDQRISLIALTPQGLVTKDLLKRTAWQEVEKAVAQACNVPATDLLSLLSDLEEALSRTPLARRVETPLPKTTED